MINPIVYLTERIFSAKPLETNPPEFNLKSIHQGHHQVTYKGIRCLKCPFDYVMYQMILWETKPDLIIEIGTLTGGGTLYLADILDQIGKGQIHSIDIVNQSDPLVKKHKRIKLFYDGWEKYPLPDRRKFKKIIVIDDGAHTYEQVRDALTKFSPLINKNSYYIIEDGILSYLKTPLKYHGGPIRAIDEFLSQNNHFVIDKRWRDMFGFNTTFNTNGYLKRI